MVARLDKTTDPAIMHGLLTARRGQAYYTRKLNQLSDDDLSADSLLPGWNRRQLVAHVGLNARALTRLTEWAVTEIETPMYDSPTQRSEDIDFAATLPAQALRNLSDHAAIHLNVEWRDLPADAWAREVRTGQGRVVPVSETVWMRTREVWIHAVDLANGGSFRDFPDAVIDGLIRDILGAWAKRRDSEGLLVFAFEPTDRANPSAPQITPAEITPADVTVRGPAWRLAEWAAGRSSGWALTTGDGSPVPVAPRWL